VFGCSFLDRADFVVFFVIGWKSDHDGGLFSRS
jgi:hypothetical protein